MMHAQDPEGFVENGGWDFLDAEGGDDDEEGDESEEEGACLFQPPFEDPYAPLGTQEHDVLQACMRAVRPWRLIVMLPCSGCCHSQP